MKKENTSKRGFIKIIFFLQSCSRVISVEILYPFGFGVHASKILNVMDIIKKKNIGLIRISKLGNLPPDDTLKSLAHM